MFKARVIEALKQKRQPIEEADSQTDDSSTEESDSLIVTVANQEDATGSLESPQYDINIHKQHEEFLRKQVTLAEQYLEKKRQMSTVSSKRSIEEDPSCPVAKKADLERKGPRTVPRDVKNRRRKMKKRRAKERAYAAAHNHGKQE